jgi:hypothetical protein
MTHIYSQSILDQLGKGSANMNVSSAKRQTRAILWRFAFGEDR